jgi:hypothetical protein
VALIDCPSHELPVTSTHHPPAPLRRTRGLTLDAPAPSCPGLNTVPTTATLASRSLLLCASLPLRSVRTRGLRHRLSPTSLPHAHQRPHSLLPAYPPISSETTKNNRLPRLSLPPSPRLHHVCPHRQRRLVPSLPFIWCCDPAADCVFCGVDPLLPSCSPSLPVTRLSRPMTRRS